MMHYPRPMLSVSVIIMRNEGRDTIYGKDTHKRTLSTCNVEVRKLNQNVMVSQSCYQSVIA